VLWLRKPPQHLSLGVVAGLILLTRFDLVVVIAPLLAVTVIRPWRIGGALRIAIGATPLLAWAVFATLYFGFFFPNTAWAKQLAIDVPRGELLRRGWGYLVDSIGADPLTLTAIALAAVIAIVWSRAALPVAVAMVGYVAYAVWIGGDFMSGRFFTIPVLLAAAIVSTAMPTIPVRPRRIAWAVMLLLAVVSTLMRVGALPPLTKVPGLSDEPAVYADLRLTRLLATDGRSLLDHPMARGGLEARQRATDSVEVANAVGMRGYFGGPRVHIVDVLGLGDPLLARLPVSDRWRAGHFPRLIPGGYVETIATGHNQITHPGLAAYYDALRTITRDAVFDPNRLGILLRFRLGAYDHLLEEYLSDLERAGDEAPSDDATDDNSSEGGENEP
jgi:arabinofuranosyltransferase